jgi:GNAT superfamily N-acetyltransferase
MHYRIAPIHTEDVAAVRALMAQVVRHSVTREPGLLAETLANVNANVDHWLAHPQTCVHLKATLDGAPDDAPIGVLLIKHHWNLCSLFVEPAHHGRGIGRALVEEGARLCRGRSPKDALWLNAARDAIPFYRRLGFAERPTSQALPAGYLAMSRPL